MVELDKWRPIEVQPKSSLHVPLGTGTYHRGLLNIMEPFGAIGQGEEVATTSISTQRTRGPVEDQLGTGAQGNAPPMPLLGTINVIFATLGRIESHPSRVMFVAKSLVEDSNSEPKRARIEIRPSLSFSDEDKIGTI